MAAYGGAGAAGGLAGGTGSGGFGGSGPGGAAAAAAAPFTLEHVVPAPVLRTLVDRSFEKRKTGAAEVERIMRKLREAGGAGNALIIRRTLEALARDYACSVTNANFRKGGLVALASAAIGLGSAASDYLDIMVPAVCRSFLDQEARVRYYACESLFNIAKVARGGMLGATLFAEVFGGVCKLAADSDMDVRNGAKLLDSLLKEIVMEVEALDVQRFMPLLRANMRSTNPYARQLLVSWVTQLDTLPGVDMLDHLPALLEGLFDMLSDGNREIRQQAYTALTGFLEQMGRVPAGEWGARVAFRPLVEVLLAQTSRERDKFCRLTALEWLLQFVALGQRTLAPVYHRLVAGVLRCLSDPEPEIGEEAARTNGELMALVRSTPLPQCEAAIPAIVAAVTAEVRARDRLTRSAALRWVAMMLALDPERVMGAAPLLGALLANLVDSDDAEVMRLDLEVLARMAVYSRPFLRGRVLPGLVQLFADNRSLLEAKGVFILRRLCLLLDGRTIYCALARLLLRVDNREFASLIIELLNLILLTAIELTELRESLRGCAAPSMAAGVGSGKAVADSGATAGSAGSGAAPALLAATPAKPSASAATVDSSTALVAAAGSAADASTGTAASGSSAGDEDDDLLTAPDPEDGLSVFLLLYRTWAGNPLACLGLCLLTEAYELGARLVCRLGETAVSVGMLMQADKLVQLLESPVFLTTRLHLTQPERPDQRALLRCLYGLLMLMPQGTAYATLRDRLTSVTSLHIALGSGAGTMGMGMGGGFGTSHGPAALPGAAPATAAAGSSAGGGGLSVLGPAYAYDVDGVLSAFTASQAAYKAALREELRAKSVLHRYTAIQAQAAQAQAAQAAQAQVQAAAAVAAQVAAAAAVSAAVGPATPAGGLLAGSSAARSSTRLAAADAGIVGDADGDVDADGTGAGLPSSIADLTGAAGSSVAGAAGGASRPSVGKLRHSVSLRDELRGISAAAAGDVAAAAVEGSSPGVAESDGIGGDTPAPADDGAVAGSGALAAAAEAAGDSDDEVGDDHRGPGGLRAAGVPEESGEDSDSADGGDSVE